METFALAFALTFQTPGIIQGPGYVIQNGGATVITESPLSKYSIATGPPDPFFIPKQSRFYQYGTGDKPTPAQVERRRLRATD
jgi:hypothetical protein